MSIFRVENDKYGNQCYSLYPKLIYIMRAGVARLEYIYGAGVSIVHTYQEMMFVKEAFHATKGKGFFHYILNPEESLDVNAFFRAGIVITEMIAKYKGNYQAIMAIHFGEAVGDMHIHFIVNNIDSRTGERMNLNRDALIVLKQKISRILISHGISPIRQNDFKNDGNKECVIDKILAL